jgi:hypothetical protein
MSTVPPPPFSFTVNASKQFSMVTVKCIPTQLFCTANKCN